MMISRILGWFRKPSSTKLVRHEITRKAIVDYCGIPGDPCWEFMVRLGLRAAGFDLDRPVQWYDDPLSCKRIYEQEVPD